MIRFYIAFLIICSSCNSSVSSDEDIANRTDTTELGLQKLKEERLQSSARFEKSQLFGAWTDGSNENATFDIGKDSIFYLDQMESFPYTLKGDSLTIVYPDMSFQGTAKLISDTLVLSDPEFGTTKYTRFKD